MASRKHLKKSINLICGELFADCVALNLCKQADTKVLDDIMTEILQIRNEYVARINHTEKGQERLFYKKLRSEFTEKVNDLSERIIKA